MAGAFLVLALVASVWLAIDRRPPEWDHANHLERAVQCSRDLRAGDVRGILERSSFYPPLVLCLAGAGILLGLSDAAAGGRRHDRLPRARHGRGVPARARPGRRHGGRRGRAAVRQRAVRRVLHAALSARPAAGGDGHPGARGAARHRPLHPSADGARLRGGVRSRDADQADVRAVRAGAGRDGPGAGRPARARQRGAGDPRGDRDQSAVVRAPTVRSAGPARGARRSGRPPRPGIPRR